jgi:hypothetical protein
MILKNVPHGAESLEKKTVASDAPNFPYKRISQLFTNDSNLPLYFIENQGQFDDSVKYYARASHHTILFTDSGFSICLHRKGKRTQAHRHRHHFLRLWPVEMEKGVKVTAENPQTGKINYLRGNDPGAWKKNIATYQSLVYRNLYTGIDMEFYGTNRQLKYDIIIRPGGDPAGIAFNCEGAESLHVTERGDLSMTFIDDDVLVQRKPLIFQEISGKRMAVPGRFKILQKGSNLSYGFEVASYDKRHPLVIDPVITSSTYLGGSSWDKAQDVTMDGAGNIYIVGWTESFDFPLRNPIQKTHKGKEFVYITDIFITKMNPEGNKLIYSTFLGGSIYKQKNAADFAKSIAVDWSGNCYITGYTNSEDFPTKEAFQPKLAGGYDAFVAKINASGSALDYATFLGGKGDDYGHGIAVDKSGNAFVTGYTTSKDFPDRNDPKQSPVDQFDVYIVKLNITGSALDYATFLGGSGNDYSRDLAVDAEGRAYVTGYTNSPDFPTRNALQPKPAGGRSNAFAVRLKATGGGLDYATYLGGSKDDYASAIAVNSSNHAYITGKTNSDDFPTERALQKSKAENYDAFVVQIKSSGRSLNFSTYLGGNSVDDGQGIDVDSSGNTYVTGHTRSTDFPTKDSFQNRNAGGLDAFVTKINATGEILDYSTYIGGNGTDFGLGIVADDADNAYVTGYTDSTNFPVKSAFQQTKSNSLDAFVMKIAK